MNEDTYFLNAQEAFRVASEQNHKDGNKYILQVCYYHGQKIDTELVNLIHSPIESLVKNLSNGIYRFPSILDFNGLDLTDEVKIEIAKNFNLSILKAKELRAEKHQEYIDVMRTNILDFNEPLRFYLIAHASTEVMQYSSKAIADSLVKKGYEVFFNIHYGIEDNSSYKQIAKFKPHVTININHLNNTLIADDVFNFIWFQDPMPILLDNSDIILRKRDIIFSVLDAIDDLIVKKGINKNEIIRQSIRTNRHIYKIDEDVIREEKIVFIGGSYKKYEEYENIMQEIRTSFRLKTLDLNTLAMKYSLDIGVVKNYLYASVLRQEIVKYFCKYSKLKVEIYGPGWDQFSEIQPYYKGVLEYGEDVSKVYNSAKYALVPNGYYQQRLFEMVCSGTIPIVYSSPMEKDVFKYENSCLVFKDLEGIDDITSRKVKDDLQLIVRDASYNEFVDKVINIIKLN